MGIFIIIVLISFLMFLYKYFNSLVKMCLVLKPKLTYHSHIIMYENILEKSVLSKEILLKQLLSLYVNW